MSVKALCQGVASLAIKTPNVSFGRAQNGVYVSIFNQVRWNNIHKIFQPVPEDRSKNYRFKVHFPEDGQYTVKPLKMTKLAGRDPDTGRVIVGTLGGGHKRNYRWIDPFRTGPEDGTFYEERVIHIQYDPNRAARIALVAGGEKLRYLIATENMKAGDLIRTSSHVPKIPVRPKEGDAYAIGALPSGTIINCLETLPGQGAILVRSAGSSATVMKRIGEKVVVQLPSKRQLALDPKCMATVGRVSNVDHNKIPIGSAQRNRWLGRRPASGLWQRKTGYDGRKIRALPPVKHVVPKPKKTPMVVFTLASEGPPRPVVPSTLRYS